MKQVAKESRLSFKEKIELAKLLDKLGVDLIELDGIKDPRIDALLIKSIVAAVRDSRIVDVKTWSDFIPALNKKSICRVPWCKETACEEVIKDEEGNIKPKIKLSENVGKITTPHFKKVYRLKDRETGMAEADLICVHDEVVDDTQPLEIFDPIHTWKRKVMENFTAEELQKPIYLDGKQVYELPTLQEIRLHCEKSIKEMWDEVRRFTNPHNYYVDLSEKLWRVKNEMIQERRGGKRS